MSTRRSYLGHVCLVVTGATAGCLSSGEDLTPTEPEQKTQLEERHDVLVEMEGVSFIPDEITVTVGDSVVWYNAGDSDHSVTAFADGIPSGATYFASGPANSESEARDLYWSGGEESAHDEERRVGENGAIKPGGWYSHTFQTPGTHQYFCIPHEEAEMDGSVTVQQEATESP